MLESNGIGLLFELLYFLRWQRESYMATIQTHENIFATIKRGVIHIFRFLKRDSHSDLKLGDMVLSAMARF